MSDRPASACPGYCCAAFYWPRTLADMRKHPERSYDGDKIADMLIPLTPKQARERYERFSGRTGVTEYSWKHRGHYFTCRHWDEDTRLCGIYEERPQMCRDYPYGQECAHGCGAIGGVSTEERFRIREEQACNQWKAYVSPNPPSKLA